MPSRPAKSGARKTAVAARPVPRTARRATPKVAVAEPAWEPVPEAGARADPPAPATPAVHEPVWLVRIVLALFLVGFAAFLAREVANFLTTLP